MSVTAQPLDPTSEVTASMLRKVVIAGAAGTVIEWFDFAIYGFMAPILALAFFPGSDPVVGLLQTFAVFAVAFALRPVGGAFFGLLGDKIGRKRVLAMTVIFMSGGTAVIGLIPSYAQIGVWAAILLTLARCVQGFSAGGEYAGAVTYVIEHAPSNHRSRYSSWMPAATFGSFAVAALLSFFLTANLSTAAMDGWGWRITFLVAAPLGLVAFYIRNRLTESPLFQKVLDGPRPPQPRLGRILKQQWSPMLRLGGYISLTAVSFYIFSTYMTTFLRLVVKLPSDLVLMTNVIALAIAAVIAPLIGLVCDRVGRRPMMFASIILLGALSIPAYMIASGGNISDALVAQVMLALGAVTANVVTAVLLAELFSTQVRYTASAITYNISYALFGGTAPFVATLLISVTGNRLSPAIYIVVIALIAFIATLFIPETAGKRLDEAPIQSRDEQALRQNRHASTPNTAGLS